MIKAENGCVQIKGTGGRLLVDFMGICRGMLMTIKDADIPRSEAKKIIRAAFEVGLEAPDEFLAETSKDRPTINDDLKDNLGRLQNIIAEVLKDA